ncbi:tetratricopeptide repeat protein [Bacillus sp. 179-C3.3 HS]|uniref:response regulator aspartate phosphatase n=1 Tax=Bacillus sp. 179-C3.3 HS TaxID=3232162 RepID=UPI0039A19A1E
MEKILSSHVGVKINEWYKMIRQFSVPDAEILKAEVEEEIERMEEDQDLLIYYQLMCFRHQLMLDYIKPSTDRSVSTSDLVDKIENSNHQLSGMLQYYNAFFRGMYEFSQKEYVQAIQFYKVAEKQLALVIDEIEQAEFHFKVAEAYYIMKQTHVSMHHIMKALDIYEQYDQYKVRQIQSLIIIAGNYDDFKRFEKSLEHLTRAYSIAKEIPDNRLMAKLLLNIGNTYDRQQLYTKAMQYYHESLTLSEKHVPDLKPVIYVNLCWTLYKAGENDEAAKIADQAMNGTSLMKNAHEMKLLTSIRTIYESNDEKEIQHILQMFEEKQLFVFIEEFTKNLAVIHEKKGDFEKAAEYYRKALKAQYDIQKGECIYEY